MGPGFWAKAGTTDATRAKAKSRVCCILDGVEEVKMFNAEGNRDAVASIICQDHAHPLCICGERMPALSPVHTSYVKQ